MQEFLMKNSDKVINEAKTIFMNAKKSHDWDHTQRVYNLCLKIGEKEKADTEILKLAAVLHDIGRVVIFKKDGRKLNHAERGAVKAAEILENHKFSKEIIEKVVHCVETHRFRDNKEPQSLEARVLFDADKIDAIGAIGIGRAFVYSGEIGAKVHNKNIDIEKTREDTEEDTAYREYMVKLKKIKDRLFTEEGRKMAEGRHRFMEEFFSRINKEVDGEL
jgi:uncharacterized protein